MIPRGLALALLLAALALAQHASRADTDIEIAADLPKQEDKIAVVVMPDALQKAVARSHRAGDDNWVAINLMVGNPTGLRAEVFPFTSGNIKVGIEGIAGTQRWSYAGGGGIRLQIRVAGNAKNAFYVSPGVDVYVSPPSTAHFGHYGTLYFVASDVDLSWLHEFSDHFAYELGFKVGGGVELNAPPYESLTGTAFVPDLSIFTGVRF